MADQLTIKEIFQQAIDIESDSQRQEFISSVCGGDEKREIQVLDLLDAHEQAGSFLDSPVSKNYENGADDFDLIQDKIGPYEILKRIGQGGFGQVFVAQQNEPVRRKVALKVIRPGMGSREVLARFDIERQTLAVMNHPNIAKVFDGGSTSNGQPYFVMELVHGFPIHKFCQKNELDIRERLELFRTVCRGVQHAHQKGIIHRDLKPSNILVSNADGEAVPKVIDFGVAKAIVDPHVDETALTRESQFIGTPQYMSPEQASMQSRDIDVRSDIYSLGAILYELLTGTAPIDQSQLKHANFDEIRQLIREEDPPKPSLRITNSIANPELSTANGSQSKTSRLSRSLRSDLDWIVMKALEKDRDRRYQNVAEFSDDIDRFLNDEPVKARPPSKLYRAKKFVRKNRAFCAATAFVMTTLIAATAFSSWQAFRATKAVAAEKLAKANEAEQKKLAIAKADEAELARNREMQKRKQAEAIRDMFVSIFSSPHPEASGYNVTVRDFLDSAAARIPEEFPNDTDTKRILLETLGTTYFGLGLYGDGVKLNELSLELAPPQELLTTKEAISSRITLLNRLAQGYLYLDKFEEALSKAKTSSELATKNLDARHILNLQTELVVGDCLQFSGQPDHAFKKVEMVGEILSPIEGETGETYLETHAKVAVEFLEHGYRNRAIPLLRSVLSKQHKIMAANSYSILSTKTYLATALSEGGTDSEKREALNLINDVLDNARQLVRDNHSWIVDIKANKARILSDQAQFGEAIEIGNEILAHYKAEFGTEHRLYLRHALEMVRYYRLDRQVGEARRLMDLIEPASKKDFQVTKNALLEYNRAQILVNEKKYEAATPTLTAVSEHFDSKQGESASDSILANSLLARCYLETGKQDESLALYLRTLDNLIEGHGELHPRAPNIHNSIGHLYHLKRNFSKAIKHYRKAMDISSQVFGRDSAITVRTLNKLGMAFRDTGQMQEHEKYIKKAVEVADKHLPNSVFYGHQARFNLAVIYRMQRRYKDAIPLLKTITESQQEVSIHDRDHVMFTDAVSDLAFNYIFLKDRENAPAAYKRMMNMCRQQLKDDPNRYASSLATACKDLNQYGFHELAEQSLIESIEIREKIMPGNWLIQNSKSILGETVYRKATSLKKEGSNTAEDQFQKAEKLLTESFTAMLKQVDSIPTKYRQTRMKEAVRRLIKFYKSTDDDDRVEFWEARLKDIKNKNYDFETDALDTK